MSTTIPRRILPLVTLLGLALGAGQRQAAADLVVDPSGGGDHRTIQAAVEAARDGETIRIRPGRYRGSGDVVIDLGAKDLELVATAVDCESEGETSVVIDGESQRQGLRYQANGEAGITSEVRIEGLTFVNCVTDGDGGAIYLGDVDGTAEITCCRFIRNESGASGGAIFVDGGRQILVSSSIFSENRSRYEGGGIGLGYGPGRNRFDVEECAFWGNQSLRGGAISALRWRGPISIFRSDFTSNAAYRGGALLLSGSPAYDGPHWVGYSNFDRNLASAGGAISARHSDGLLMHSSRFSENAAEDGEAIEFAAMNAQLVMSRCEFARDEWSRGAAVSAVGEWGWVAVLAMDCEVWGGAPAGTTAFRLENAWGYFDGNTFSMPGADGGDVAIDLSASSFIVDRNAYCGLGRLVEGDASSYVSEYENIRSAFCWHGFPSPEGTYDLEVRSSSVASSVIDVDGTILNRDDRLSDARGDAVRSTFSSYGVSYVDGWMGGTTAAIYADVQGVLGRLDRSRWAISFDLSAEAWLESWNLEPRKRVGVGVEVVLEKEVSFRTRRPITLTLQERSAGVVLTRRLWQEQDLSPMLWLDGTPVAPQIRSTVDGIEYRWNVSPGNHLVRIGKRFGAEVRGVDPDDVFLGGPRAPYRPIGGSTFILSFDES